MNVANKLRNVLRGLLQRYGSKGMKRYLWDREFAGGHWTCLERMTDDRVCVYLERYTHKGNILDLGCGPGNAGIKLDYDSYQSYTGVDISNLAIEKASKSAGANGRSQKNEYFQSDIITYVPQKQYDVVLFGDSLYYVPHQRIVPMLTRYSESLKQGGVFIARMFDVSGKHKLLIDTIEDNFVVVEKQIYEPQVCVIVFRSLSRRHDAPEANPS